MRLIERARLRERLRERRREREGEGGKDIQRESESLFISMQMIHSNKLQWLSLEEKVDRERAPSLKRKSSST